MNKVIHIEREDMIIRRKSIVVRRLEAQQVNRRSNEKSSSVSKSNRRESLPKNPVNPIAFIDSNISTREKTLTGKGLFYDIALIIGISLLLLHIYLCYKLYSFDQSIPRLDTICFNQCLQSSCLEEFYRNILFDFSLSE